MHRRCSLSFRGILCCISNGFDRCLGAYLATGGVHARILSFGHSAVIVWQGAGPVIRLNSGLTVTEKLCSMAAHQGAKPLRMEMRRPVRSLNELERLELIYPWSGGPVD